MRARRVEGGLGGALSCCPPVCPPLSQAEVSHIHGNAAPCPKCESPCEHVRWHLNGAGGASVLVVAQEVWRWQSDVTRRTSREGRWVGTQAGHATTYPTWKSVQEARWQVCECCGASCPEGREHACVPAWQVGTGAWCRQGKGGGGGVVWGSGEEAWGGRAGWVCRGRSVSQEVNSAH